MLNTFIVTTFNNRLSFPLVLCRGNTLVHLHHPFTIQCCPIVIGPPWLKKAGFDLQPALSCDVQCIHKTMTTNNLHPVGHDSDYHTSVTDHYSRTNTLRPSLPSSPLRLDYAGHLLGSGLLCYKYYPLPVTRMYRYQQSFLHGSNDYNMKTLLFIAIHGLNVDIFYCLVNVGLYLLAVQKVVLRNLLRNPAWSVRTINRYLDYY